MHNTYTGHVLTSAPCSSSTFTKSRSPSSQALISTGVGLCLSTSTLAATMEDSKSFLHNLCARNTYTQEKLLTSTYRLVHNIESIYHTQCRHTRAL